MFPNQTSPTQTIFIATFAGLIYSRVSLNVTHVFQHLVLAALRKFCHLEMALSSVPCAVWKAGYADVERCSQFNVDPLATW